MSTVTALPAGTWSLDPTHTHIGFTVRHMMVAKVRGSFSDFSAEITVAENPLESSLSAVVQMASIDTGNGDRDGHLRTNDFFSIDEFPTMTLTSTSIEPTGDHHVLHADLTIKEKALARAAPPATAGRRYRPPDRLLAFLEAL
jgi:polyisoprenoid-binding protein YceI